MTWLLSPDGFLDPRLSHAGQGFLRWTYAVLLLATLVRLLPHARRFFLSERWGGYVRSSAGNDAVQNPVVLPVILFAWLTSAALLLLDRWTLAAAGANLLLCRYFFVSLRWESVGRGLGAPGFLTYWVGGAVFLLELTSALAPQSRSLALLVLQADFAAIMLSAGLYKMIAGYPRNTGMELGLANPQWGYWWRWYRRLPPRHGLFRLLNHLAWSTEVAAALLLLVPPTRFLGALLVIVSFAFIATQIRLGLLCEMVMLCGLLYFHPESFGDAWIGELGFTSASATGTVTGLGKILGPCLWTYLALLPLAHASLFYNLIAKRRLPGTLQPLLEAYTNFFGIIVWRVFSVDLVNFFVRVCIEPAGTGERTLVSRYGALGEWRYNHVAESITVTSLFTTLKYYPADDALFRERLVRYARTVPCPPGARVVFEYVSIDKEPERFVFENAAEFVVDPESGTVVARHLVARERLYGAASVSPIHPGSRPGSYVPASA